jgi:hypothetical protein
MIPVDALISFSPICSRPHTVYNNNKTINVFASNITGRKNLRHLLGIFKNILLKIRVRASTFKYYSLYKIVAEITACDLKLALSEQKNMKKIILITGNKFKRHILSLFHKWVYLAAFNTSC